MGTLFRRSGSGQRGLTLLEILLATLILAMVVAMVTTSLSGSVEVVNATRDQGEVFHRAQVALQRISEDLASALLVEGVDFIGSEEAGSRTPVLSFASTAHVVFDPEHDQPGIAHIGYWLVEDRDQRDELLLLRSDERLAITGGNEAGGPLLLSDRLRSLRFTFRDQTGEEFDRWTTVDDDTTDPEPPRLPVAVTIAMELWLDRERDSSVEFTTSVLLPAGLIRVEEDADAP